MQWIKFDNTVKLPIKSWCEPVEPGAIEQAVNLANHPVVQKHVALMPDCHQGYGMPIGGVIACSQAVIPNAVGVDIGCGMGAVETAFPAGQISDLAQIREIVDYVKARIPVGEGHAHKTAQTWDGFARYLKSIGIEEPLTEFTNPMLPAWLDADTWRLALHNLGTLGGGNHFIELQKSATGMVWLMLHSGSRNLGYKIAAHYHHQAVKLNTTWHSAVPDSHLAFLPVDSPEGRQYLRDMQFALEYAAENRQRMMRVFKEAVKSVLGVENFIREINIHHNYAALEHHFNQNLWVHRKGATSAKAGELGIIPGSMGTASYIVKGKGNPDAFMSCSHGAGRKMSRTAACETLNIEECNQAMEGIVFDRFSKYKPRNKNKEDKGLYDLSEAPLAYKDIDAVIAAELDLIEPLVKLQPLGVVKG